MEKNIKVPVKNEDLTDLKIGDVITLTGNIITARDQAHKRILEQGAPLDIEGAAIFHAGPIISEDENGYKMVAVGPTTSMRMNPYQSDVIDMGPKIVIGKGGMDDTVRKALVKNNALYVVATGGCAALYVDAVEEIESVETGDIAAIVGLKDCFTGDTICDENKPNILEKIDFEDKLNWNEVLDLCVEIHDKLIGINGYLARLIVNYILVGFDYLPVIIKNYEGSLESIIENSENEMIDLYLELI